MSNPSIESQVTELLRGAKAAMFANINNKIEIAILAERLRTELKAIAGASCHPGIDREVEALLEFMESSFEPQSIGENK